MDDSRGRESGFVLLAAIWLLVLAASIAAALMLRSMTAARGTAAEAEALRDKLALDGAAEAAIASLIFEGNRSAWTGAPRPVTIGGRDVAVTLSSENGRLDINKAEVRTVDAALRGVGTAAEERQRITQALAARRAAGRDYAATAELRTLLSDGAAAKSAACALDLFTLFSGLAAPAPNQMSDKLARALGMPGGGFTPENAGGGAALRIEAALPSGVGLTVVVRATGISDEPLMVHRWDYARDCR